MAIDGLMQKLADWDASTSRPHIAVREWLVCAPSDTAFTNSNRLLEKLPLVPSSGDYLISKLKAAWIRDMLGMLVPILY